MPLTLHVDAMTADGLRLYVDQESGAAINTQGNPERDRQSEDCCRGGLFLPDETYVPTTLAEARRLYRRMGGDPRTGGRVPGDRSDCVDCEELFGFAIHGVGMNAITREPARSYKAVGNLHPKVATTLTECSNPLCFGTVNEAGVCSECRYEYFAGNPMEGTQKERLD